MRLNNKDLEYLESSFSNEKIKERFYIEASNSQALFISGNIFKYDSYTFADKKSKVELDINKLVLNNNRGFLEFCSSKVIERWFKYFLLKDENIIEEIFQDFFKSEDLSRINGLNYLTKFVLSNNVSLSTQTEEKLMLGYALKNSTNNFKNTTNLYANLILRNIENGCSQTTIIKSLKDYLRSNVVLTKNNVQFFTKVIEKIKDWELKEYLTDNEIDTFFGKEIGIVMEETKGYHYKIDTFKLNQELKIKSGVIYNNVKFLFDNLPEILKEDKDFLNIVTTPKHPIIIAYISMLGSTTKDKMDMLNELITVVSQYPKSLSKEDIIDFSKKWFFKERLSKNLENNDVKNTKLKKI